MRCGRRAPACRSAAFALVFPPHTLPPEAVTAEAAAGAPGVPWAGMSSDGVIGADGSVRRGCAAIAFDASVRVGVGVGGNVGSDPRAAAAHATEAALAALDAGGALAPAAVLRSGPQQPRQDPPGRLRRRRARTCRWRAAAPTRRWRPARGDGAVRRRARPIRDSVVAVALVSPAPIGIGTGHGCVPTGIPAVVTGSSGRTVHAINGRAAEDVYLEEIGHGREDLTDEEFERLAVVHPLVQLGLRAVRPRHVRGRAPGGGLLCAAQRPRERGGGVQRADAGIDPRQRRGGGGTGARAAGRPAARDR